MGTIHRWIRQKRLHFEYWPYQLFYFPMLFYGIWLALRSRSAMYFSTANPGMLFGGVMGESKMKVLRSLPAQYVPATCFCACPHDTGAVCARLEEQGMGFPLVAKPDRGERGRMVEKIADRVALGRYLERTREDVLLQAYVDYPVELGVLYYRHPGEASGHISSVVRKGFLEIRGDGRSTLGEMVMRNPRARSRAEYLRRKYPDQWNAVLPEDSPMLVEPIGNHNRGTIFFDANHLVTAGLVRVFDAIAAQITGFHYGRFDLRVPSLDDLYAGRNIKILELNGVSSEPGHIYDPENSLLRAWGDVLRHMNIIWRIAAANHRAGFRRAPLAQFLQELRAHYRRNRLRARALAEG